MLSTKTLISRLILLVCIFFSFRQSYSQIGNAEVFQEPDTSDYLPSYYNGYLDNNLMIASSKGYNSEIERLLSKGADVRAETSEGATALIFAVANNQLSSVKLLIDHNSDVNKITSQHDTPLIISSKNDNPEIAELLIRAGADIDESDRFNATALHYASIHGNFYLTDLLLYYEADKDKKAQDGTTPLMASIWAGYPDIADLLIQNGVNLEARDNEGFTPFLIAAQKGDTVLMNLLKKEGTDIYEKNNYNYNALDLAIGFDSKTTVEFLLKAGDKWFSSGKEGVNPYYVASAFGRIELFDFLEKRNIPGKPKPKIDELAINFNSRVNTRDYFMGVSFVAKEPLLNAGLIAGCDLKFWYTRILMKTDKDVYYQFMDKSSVVYGGIFKDFTINEYLTWKKLSFSASLMVAYPFGNKFKGTNETPDNKLSIVPSAGLKLEMKSFQLTAGIEYMKSPFYRVGPLWLRVGASHNFYFNKVRAPAKVIKWY